MKNVKTNFKNYLLYVGVFFLAFSLNSCSDDDDGVIEETDPPTGTITASDQTLSGNTLIIEDVTVGQDSWIVVRNADNQQLAADPYLIRDNEDGEVRIELNENANLTGDIDGDDFDVSLYADNPTQGTQGTFDEGFDEPIRDATNTAVTERVNTTAPSISIDDDSPVSEEGDVTFTSVNTGTTGGYIGLYRVNEDGTVNYDEMVGTSQYIEPGEQTNVTARFNEGFEYEAGQTYAPRLYTDNPNDQQFTFTESGGTEDVPETYGFNTTTGEANFVRNSAATETLGGFTINNSGTGVGPGM